MGKLTTHVLDTAQGRPAPGIPVRLWRIDPSPGLLCETSTNADGRCDAPLLEGAAVQTGVYEIVFEVGAYFGEQSEPPFLDRIAVRFGISAPEGHIHVPLLISPYGYTTYRGS